MSTLTQIGPMYKLYAFVNEILNTRLEFQGGGDYNPDMYSCPFCYADVEDTPQMTSHIDNVEHYPSCLYNLAKTVQKDVLKHYTVYTRDK